MKKVIVFGTFDIIHPGHIHLLKEAKEYGDFLIAVIARDKTVTEIKGRPPRNSESIRLKNMEDLKLIDKVILGELEDKYKAIAEEKRDIIALGYDQKKFIDDLEDAIEDHVRIVRLAPHQPEIYKSSKMPGGAS